MTLLNILLVSLQLMTMLKCRTAVPVAEVSESKSIPVENIAAPEEKPDYQLETVMKLPEVLTECSGMAKLGHDRLVALNDSGNKPYLYIFSEKDKKDVRTVKVSGVKNNDWEELASDDKNIYVGDFGNNGGTRQNLMVYKISKEDLLKSDEVKPEIISFRYDGQTKFNDSNRHNFDCEAMICKGDSLFLFSKNRGDFRTDVYGLPKAVGEHIATKMGSFDSEGLITGADFISKGNGGALALVGYSIHGKAFYPFILYFPDVQSSRFLDGPVERIKFDQVLQTETIIFHDSNDVYLTNEEEDGSDGRIYKVHLKN
ncbi:hypothetical protein H7X65_00240 [Candidatus Parcubacteria bacterium]|nr:hypothetical protein [Candidatus Parcubacteria bacterium]